MCTWDTPINSSNGSYGNVRLHDIKSEAYWQGVNYLVNNVDRYSEKNDDLTGLEVQIALWSIMDHKKFDMNEIPLNQLLSYVRDGGFDQDLIDTIMNDVKDNKSSLDPSQPGNQAYYAQIDDAQHQIIIIPGQGYKKEEFDVRFRNLTSSAAQHEIYLGVGDLGVEANREQKDATFTQNRTTPIDFAYNARANELSASVGGDYVIYENLSDNMPANCSIGDVDHAELWVAARDAGTTVTLSGSAMAQPFSVSADGNGIKNRF
ncbi:hypothetical protein [Rhodohalobacter sp. 8-1]|uniref:hypothetical protein n=1 Tax=Rhodohalobacter sp. 8-1 TaxID=3131972 RepID=UPI0030ED4746